MTVYFVHEPTLLWSRRSMHWGRPYALLSSLRSCTRERRRRKNGVQRASSQRCDSSRQRAEQPRQRTNVRKRNPRLECLVSPGVTAIELMALAEWAGAATG